MGGGGKGLPQIPETFAKMSTGSTAGMLCLPSPLGKVLLPWLQLRPVRKKVMVRDLLTPQCHCKQAETSSFLNLEALCFYSCPEVSRKSPCTWELRAEEEPGSREGRSISRFTQQVCVHVCLLKQ